MNITELFHPYGLIIGIAAVLAISLVQKKSKAIAVEFGDSTIFLTLASGLIGARLWHVFTDFHLYKNNILEMFQIWQGGLSIIGGIVGGICMLAAIAKVKNNTLYTYLDVAIFGVPIGQAIGRVGNYVNQELYGLPTQLPWKIYIEPQYRTALFKATEYYQPLFLYESILTCSFGVWVWFFDRQIMRGGRSIIGSSWYFHLYLLYYCIGRVLLDFMRVQKTVIVAGFGINQLFLLLVAVYSSIQLQRLYAKNKS